MDGARLFSVVPSARTRGQAHKPEHGKFYLNIRKSFFTVRVTEQWKRLPREVVESPTLEILKRCPVLGNCSRCPSLSREVEPDDTQKSLLAPAIQ